MRDQPRVTLPPAEPKPLGWPPPANPTQWFHDQVQPHEPMLRAYLTKQFPSLCDIDDVVQEAHLRLLKAHETRPLESAKAYLFAIAGNVARNFFRRKKHIAELEVNDLAGWSVLDDDDDVFESASLAQEFTLATEAIDRLPARCREVVILRVLRGLTHQEIATMLNLSEATVRVQVARGMKKCAQFLREHGVERSSS